MLNLVAKFVSFKQLTEEHALILHIDSVWHFGVNRRTHRILVEGEHHVVDDGTAVWWNYCSIGI